MPSAKPVNKDPNQQRPAIVIDTTRRVPGDGARNAKALIVGMAPARDEIAQGRPFVGAAGRVLNEALYSLGWSREQVFVTNLIEFPILVGSSVLSLDNALLEPEFERLAREINEVNPNVIIALGDDPLRVLTGRQSITRWRGSILETLPRFGRRKCVATVHPAWLVRGSWKWLPIFKHIDMRRGLAEADSPDIALPKRDALIGQSFDRTMEYLDHLETQEILSFDIETAGMRSISCIGLGASPHEAISIPLFWPGRMAPYWSLDEEAAIWQRVARLLENPDIRKVAQNASFEWIYFWRYNIYPHPLWRDTMLMHHCLYPDFGGTEDIWNRRSGGGSDPGHGLAFINSQYTRTPYYKDDGRMWTPAHGPEQFWRYNAYDVMVTLDACHKMQYELETAGLEDYYESTYNAPFYSTIATEWRGIKIDEAGRERARTEALRAIEDAQRTINEIVGYPLNVRSYKQVAALVYDERKYQIRRNRNTGRVTVDKETLQYFADKRQDSLLQLILKLRDLEDFVSDVLNVPLDHGRVHTHYKLGGTDGARWSSGRSILGSGTNLQNIRRTGIARHLFLPD